MGPTGRWTRAALRLWVLASIADAAPAAAQGPAAIEVAAVTQLAQTLEHLSAASSQTVLEAIATASGADAEAVLTVLAARVDSLRQALDDDDSAVRAQVVGSAEPDAAKDRVQLAKALLAEACTLLKKHERDYLLGMVIDRAAKKAHVTPATARQLLGLWVGQWSGGAAEAPALLTLPVGLMVHVVEVGTEFPWYDIGAAELHDPDRRRALTKLRRLQELTASELASRSEAQPSVRWALTEARANLQPDAAVVLEWRSASLSEEIVGTQTLSVVRLRGVLRLEQLPDKRVLATRNVEQRYRFDCVLGRTESSQLCGAQPAAAAIAASVTPVVDELLGAALAR